MKMRKNMILLLSILCGIVLYTDCGKEDNTVQSSTLSVIREEKGTEEKKNNGELTEFDAFEGMYDIKG